MHVSSIRFRECDMRVSAYYTPSTKKRAGWMGGRSPPLVLRVARTHLITTSVMGKGRVWGAVDIKHELARVVARHGARVTVVELQLGVCV